MRKHFNTTGPIIAEEHYHVPPLERVDLEEILELIVAGGGRTTEARPDDLDYARDPGTLASSARTA